VTASIDALAGEGARERGGRSPRPALPLIVIAASLGGPAAIGTILGSFPPDFAAATVLLQHRAPLPGSAWLDVFRRYTRLPVTEITPGTTIRPGVGYLAPPSRHVVVSPDRIFHLRDGQRIRGLLASANPLLDSAAESMGRNVIAVVLTGSGRDATDGVQAVKAHGGYVIAQDHATSRNFEMPASALAAGAVDEMLPVQEIGPRIVSLVQELTGRAPSDVHAA